MTEVSPPMIRVEELTRVFPSPDGRPRAVVDRVSFAVAGGEVYGLLGPNGAGKTTTVRMILGLLRPTGGQAWIEEHPSDSEPDEVKRRVGLVTAAAGVYPQLTTREMLSFFADLYAVPPDLARERIDRLADLLDMRGYLDQTCSTLSTGQKQRSSLARALIHDPPVMLLDEPTVGLDVIGSQVVSEFIAHLRTEGRAVILCTHRLEEAERLCDRFGLLHRGKLVREGTLDQLREVTGCDGLVQMFLKLTEAGPALRSLTSDAG